MKPLSPRHARFVEGCLAGLAATEAARRAGYGPAYADKGARLLKHPGIAAALKEAQTALREKAMYTAHDAVNECDAIIKFGREKGNPMSMTKALELKTKLLGLLVERIQVSDYIDIGSALAEAKARVSRVVNAVPIPLQVEPQPSHHAQNHNNENHFGE